jgi:segregation and condensation protein B
MNVEKDIDILKKIPEEKRDYISVVEALLFSSESPVTIQKIREIVSILTPKEAQHIIQYLNVQYRLTKRSFEIREIAGGYQMFTLSDYAAYITKLIKSKQQSRLTQKALETLAIIAYKQPITKHEIEEIRGVNVDGVVKTLLSRNLTTISGRAPVPGGPFLYKTTKQFLEYFGLNTLEDLPKLKEIDELINLEEDDQIYHETILKEIDIKELGLRVDGSDLNNSDGEDGDGNEGNPS